MTKKTASAAPAVTLEDVARDVYTHQGFSTAAVDAFALRIHNDPNLVNAAVRRAAYDVLREVMRQERRRIEQERGFKPTRRYSGEELQSIAMGSTRFFSWRLPNGTLLAEAVKGDLLLAADVWQRDAEGCATRARFMRFIASELKDGEVVKDHLTPLQLEKLHDKAKNNSPPANTGKKAK